MTSFNPNQSFSGPQRDSSYSKETEERIGGQTWDKAPVGEQSKGISKLVKKFASKLKNKIKVSPNIKRRLSLNPPQDPVIKKTSSFARQKLFGSSGRIHPQPQGLYEAERKSTASTTISSLETLREGVALELSETVMVPEKAELKNELSQMIGQENNSSYKESCTKLWNKLEEADSEITRLIEEFPGRYAEKLLEKKEHKGADPEALKEDIKQKLSLLSDPSVSWNSLKSDLGDEMALIGEGISWEEFRECANGLITEVVDQACSATGTPEVGWRALGSTGYKSDCDRTQGPKDGDPPPSPDDAVFIRNLADTAYLRIFDGLSGVKLDTENYIDLNPILRTADVVKSDEGKAKLMACEFSMAMMQMNVGFEGDDRGWAEWVREEKEFLPGGEEMQRAFDKAAQDISSYQKTQVLQTCKEGVIQDRISKAMVENGFIDEEEKTAIRTDVEKMLERAFTLEATGIFNRNPVLKNEAAAKAKTRVLQKLSDQCGEWEKEKKGIEGELRLAELRGDNEGVKALQEQLENKLIDIHWQYQLINSNLPEGTFTSSELNVTLFKEKGQKQQGMVGERKRKLSLIQKERHGSKVDRYHSKLLSLGGEGLENLPQFETSSPEELYIASFEESTQFIHKLHGMDQSDENMAEGTIDASKYANRVIDRSKRMLLQVAKDKSRGDGSTLPDGFLGLLGRLEGMEEKTFDLEVCKRGKSISASAASKMICDLIKEKNLEGEGSLEEDKEFLADKIRFISEMGLKDIDELQSRSQCFQDLWEEVFDMAPDGAFEDIRLMDKKDGRRSEQDEKIRNVLRAAVGFYDPSDSQDPLRGIVKVGQEITLQELDLGSPGKLREFNQDVLVLNREARKLAMESGSIPKPSSSFFGSKSYTRAWERAGLA